LRNFTGPKARLKSGPDVFADALVPRNVPVPRNVSHSPERFAFRLSRLRCRADLSKSFTYLSRPPAALGRAVADCAHAPRHGYRAVRQTIIGTFAKTGSLVCADDAARETRDVAMVIVVRNGRVNRSSRILTCC